MINSNVRDKIFKNSKNGVIILLKTIQPFEFNNIIKVKTKPVNMQG